MFRVTKDKFCHAFVDKYLHILVCFIHVVHKYVDNNQRLKRHNDLIKCLSYINY